MKNFTLSHDRDLYQGLSSKLSSLPHAIIGHTGSWGTPELFGGLTEKLSDFFGQGRTASGGSNLQGDQRQTVLAPSGVSGGQTQFVPLGTSGAYGVGQSQAGSGFNAIGNKSGSVQGVSAPSGGSNLDPHINPATGQWDDNYYASLQASLESDQDKTNRLIDEAYGASAGYLNEAERALRADHPNVLSDIEAQFGVAGKTLESNRDSVFGTLGSQEKQATQRKESVLADARRLYDELRRGYQQRFGGASSAGQAATELSAVEQQRQQGRTLQDYGNLQDQLNAKRVEVERDYQTKTEKLQVDKTSAIHEANREFQSKLLQISQSRAQNEQAKAQAKLQALQDLRNKIYQINLAEIEFKQALTLQYQQNQAMINSYQQNNQEVLSSALNSLNSTLSGQSFANPTSNLLVSSGVGQATTNPYIGSITNQKDEDEFASLLA